MGPIKPSLLQPIGSPPDLGKIPQLPSPARQPALLGPYALTTHIIPAAYPRSVPDVPLPRLPAEFKSVQEQSGMQVAMRDEMVERLDMAKSWQETEVSQKVLWSCVNRYARKDLFAEEKTGLTLLFAHGIGFHKEIWEPVLRHLLTSDVQRLVDEVWSFESVEHGDGALINLGAKIGAFDCSDNTCDLLNFLLNYLPMATNSTPPLHLRRLSVEEAEVRKRNGMVGRTMVGIGHSYGGLILTQAALHNPTIFSSLLLIDPTIFRPQKRCISSLTNNLVLGALRRREKWASREEARCLFRENPYFATWDPEALEVYLECALTTDPNGGVRLKMLGVEEALIYTDLRTTYEVFHLLEKLHARIELRWILPENDAGIGGRKATQERILRRPNNSSSVAIPGTNHLIAQEAPRELAQEIRKFIQRKYGLFKANL